MSPRRRRPKRSKTASALAPEWRVWVAENLAQGAPEERVHSALVAQGVPPAEATRRIEEVRSSAAFAVARRAHQRAERLAQVLRLTREQHATRAEPGSVERVAGLDADAFFERYYATSTPVVLSDFMDGWPALERWSPEALGERFADVEVDICEGRESDPDYDVNADELTTRVTMAELATRIRDAGPTNDFYMIARNRSLEGPLASLFEDVVIDRGIVAPDRLHGGCQLWLGPSGTVTPLHHDTSNILFCQVYGEKQVILASPAEEALLTHARAMYADVDPEAPDDEAHPWLADVAFRQETLRPSEALFIPAGWWHHVRALSPAISIAFVAFTRDNDRRWYCPGKL